MYLLSCERRRRACRPLRASQLLLEALTAAEVRAVTQDAAWQAPEQRPMLFRLLREVFTTAQAAGASPTLQARCRQLFEDSDVRASPVHCLPPHNPLLLCSCDALPHSLSTIKGWHQACRSGLSQRGAGGVHVRTALLRV